MPNRPRVVFVAPFGLRQKGTVSARTLPLARALVPLGFDVTVLIPPWDSPQDAGRRWNEGGVEIVNTAIGGGTGAIVARLLRAIGEIQPDIVHIVKPRAHAGLVQWLLWQRKRLSRKGPPILLDIDDWEQAWAPINHYPAPLARGLAWQEKWGIRHADGISAASHWLVDRALDYTHSGPFLYLPNGVAPFDIEQDVSPKLDGPPTVLYFTRYVEVSPAWLAEMAETLLATLPDARLVVAGRPLRPDGDQPFRVACAERCSTMADRIFWLGGVEPETIPGIFAGAQVAIFPASPVPLQQAKCSVRLATTLRDGVPVVASAVGEQSHFGAAGAARLVDGDASPAEFANAVVATLADPALRVAMAQRARAHLFRRYLWPDLAARLAHYYATFGVSPRASDSPVAREAASADT